MAVNDDVLNQSGGTQTTTTADPAQTQSGNGGTSFDVRDIVAGVATALAEQLSPAFEKIGEELRSLRTVERPAAQPSGDSGTSGTADFDRFYENPTKALDDAFRRNFEVAAREQIVPALRPIYETVSGIVKDHAVSDFERNFGDNAVSELLGEKFQKAYEALSPEQKADQRMVSHLINTLTMDESTRDKAIERFTKTRQEREEAARSNPPAMMGGGLPRAAQPQLTPTEEAFAKAVKMDPARFMAIKSGGRTVDDFPYDDATQKVMQENSAS